MKEALRLHPPLIWLPRTALVDFAVQGLRGAEGHDRRDVDARSRTRTRTASPSPQRFDPDRFAPPREEDAKHPWAYVPFGGGRHRCLGANFALMQQKAIFSVLLRRFDWSSSWRSPRATWTTTRPWSCARSSRSCVRYQRRTNCKETSMKLPGIEGKVAIVTGAGGGIGEGYAKGARGAGREGRRRRDRQGEGRARRGGDPQGRARRRSSSRWTSPRRPRRRRAAERTVAAFGGIDFLVNNAAIFGDDEDGEPDGRGLGLLPQLHGREHGRRAADDARLRARDGEARRRRDREPVVHGGLDERRLLRAREARDERPHRRAREASSARRRSASTRSRPARPTPRRCARWCPRCSRSSSWRRSRCRASARPTTWCRPACSCSRTPRRGSPARWSTWTAARSCGP